MNRLRYYQDTLFALLLALLLVSTGFLSLFRSPSFSNPLAAQGGTMLKPVPFTQEDGGRIRLIR